MTPQQFLDTMESIFKNAVDKMDTEDPEVWDDQNEIAWEHIYDALASAGGQPQGRPRRRPGS